MELQQYVLFGAGSIVLAGWLIACIASFAWLAVSKRVTTRAAIRRRLAELTRESDRV